MSSLRGGKQGPAKGTEVSSFETLPKSVRDRYLLRVTGLKITPKSGSNRTVDFLVLPRTTLLSGKADDLSLRHDIDENKHPFRREAGIVKPGTDDEASAEPILVVLAERPAEMTEDGQPLVPVEGNADIQGVRAATVFVLEHLDMFPAASSSSAEA